MHRYDYMALHRDYLDNVDAEPTLPSSGPDSIASTVSSASETTQDEYKAKYERLQESYKRLQRNNISLEEKLLNVSEKFSADKNLISRDLATQTQKVVEAKFTIQQLNKENCQLKADLKIALKLLQNKPNAFVNQKLNSLPSDLQNRVRDYSLAKERERNQRNCGQRISVPLPVGLSAGGEDNDETISAAILAKVLEERERERNKDKKFCIDIGTQTHDWIFPDPVGGGTVDKAPRRPPHTTADDEYPAGGERSLESDGSGDSRDGTKTSSSKSQSWESSFDSEGSEIKRFHQGHVSHLLLASVIQSAPPDQPEDGEGGRDPPSSSQGFSDRLPRPVQSSSSFQEPGRVQSREELSRPAVSTGHRHKNGDHRGQTEDFRTQEVSRIQAAEGSKIQVGAGNGSRLQTTISGDRRPWETTVQGRGSGPDSSAGNGTVRRSLTLQQIRPEPGGGRAETPGGRGEPPAIKPPFLHTSSVASIHSFGGTRLSAAELGGPVTDQYNSGAESLSGSGTVSLANQSVNTSRSGSFVMTRSVSYSSRQTDL